MKNSPNGPEIVTLSPGFLENIYEDAIPGVTSIQEFLSLSQGGVAILTFNIMSLPSAGYEAIEYALSVISEFFITNGHKLNLSHSALNLSGESCSSG